MNSRKAREMGEPEPGSRKDPKPPPQIGQKWRKQTERISKLEDSGKEYVEQGKVERAGSRRGEAGVGGWVGKSR